MKSGFYEWFGISMLTMSLLLSGCSGNSSNSEAGQVASSDTSNNIAIVEAVQFDEDDLDSSWSENEARKITLNGTSISTSASKGVFIDGTTATIALPGTYVVSGDLEDGQIKVKLENEGNVHLVLNGASIHNEDQAAIYIEEAGKTIITLAEGTTNTLSDGGEYVYADGEDEPTATLHSKDDLTINGSGTLVVKANYNNAIVGKDTLKLVDGNIHVTSVDDGIIGRDILAVKSGTYTLDVEGDALKTTNDNEEKLGRVYIADGSFTIDAGNDGIDSIGSIRIDNGQFNVTTGGGSDQQLSDNSSAKGIKAATQLVVNNGQYEFNNADDAFHSNGSVIINDGQYQLKTGDDGFHADSELLIENGTITVAQSYEGLEGQQITINGGTISVTATDDGVNVAGGNDGSAFGGRGGASFNSNSNALLKITGGQMYVNAAGDGLDSNGNVEMTGGTVVVSGPENSGNGALDYDGTFNMTGGTLIASGASGMAMAPSTDSSQHAILMYYPSTLEADTLIQLADEDGNVLVSFSPDKTYQSVMISSPLLEEGKTYALYSGGEAELDDFLNLGIETPAQLGTKVTSFTISDMITYVDENGVTTAQSGMGPGGMGGGGGRGGFGNGGNKEGMTRPDGTSGEKTRPDGASGEMTPPDGQGNGMTAPDSNGEMMTPPDGTNSNGGMTPPSGSDSENETQPNQKDSNLEGQTTQS